MAGELEKDGSNHALQVARLEGSPTTVTDTALQNATGFSQCYVLANDSGAAAYVKVASIVSAAASTDFPIFDKGYLTLIVRNGYRINVSGTLKIIQHAVL